MNPFKGKSGELGKLRETREIGKYLPIAKEQMTNDK